MRIVFLSKWKHETLKKEFKVGDKLIVTNELGIKLIQEGIAKYLEGHINSKQKVQLSEIKTKSKK